MESGGKRKNIIDDEHSKKQKNKKKEESTIIFGIQMRTKIIKFYVDYVDFNFPILENVCQYSVKF